MTVVDDDALDILQRWEGAGGLWQVIGRSGGYVTIDLFRCDGGEQIDLLRTKDAKVLEFVGARAGNFA